MQLTEQQLDELERLAAASLPPPWESLIEGRDFREGGASFIQTGIEGARGPDIYLNAGDFSTNVALLDLVAAMRTMLPGLIEEVRAGRARAD